MTDLELMRLYEPILRFTQGELFYPCAIDQYVAQCSLWERLEDGTQHVLAEQGDLTPARLAQFAEIPPGGVLYLRYVHEPVTGIEYQRWRRREDLPRFHAQGRLARVGLAPRIIDAFLDASLFVRGRTPGGTTAAAHLQYEALQQKDPRYVYYGRVLREGGYIVLHYLFFSVMNNWRSTFYGVNDHESDWEQVFIYLSDEAEPKPLWMSCAMHDYSGDNLRRRWDDPGLEIVDRTHPVIYAGAGSHATYFEPGEYLMQFQLQVFQPLRRAAEVIQHIWVKQLGQGEEEAERLKSQVLDTLSVPFIDYARGDGLAIGPDQPVTWTPIMIDDSVPWVHHYRGLWGLDTRDPFGGERAPAGPKYNRNGTMRQSWHNPLGWAGLHKVSPPHLSLDRLRERIQRLTTELNQVTTEASAAQQTLRTAELELSALRASEHLEPLLKQRQKDVQQQEAALNALYLRTASIRESLEAAEVHLQHISRGNLGDPRAHLTRYYKPQPPADVQTRLVEIWAAVSSGLLMIAFAGSLLIDSGNWLQRALIIIGLFLLIEATLKGLLPLVLLRFTLLLALISAGVLLVRYYEVAILLSMLALAHILIVQNLREYLGR